MRLERPSFALVLVIGALHILRSIVIFAACGGRRCGYVLPVFRAMMKDLGNIVHILL